MKQFKFLAAVPVIMALVFTSCNNSADEKKADTTPPTDSLPKTPPKEPETPPKPSNMFVVMHKVANYAKWLTVYEADDSARKANGLTNYVIGRGSGKDSNTVLVALKMADVTKA